MAANIPARRRPGGNAPEPIGPPKSGYAAQYELLLIEELSLRDSQDRFLLDVGSSDNTTNDSTSERRRRPHQSTTTLKIRAMVHRANLEGMLLAARHAAADAALLFGSSASAPPPMIGYERGLERPDASCALTALWDTKSRELEDRDARIPLSVDEDSVVARMRRCRFASSDYIAPGGGADDDDARVPVLASTMMEARVGDFFASFPECRRRDDPLLYGETDESDDEDDDDDEGFDESKPKAKKKHEREMECVEVTCSSSSPSPEKRLEKQKKPTVASSNGGMGKVATVTSSADDEMRNQRIRGGGQHPRSGNNANESNEDASRAQHHDQSRRPSSNDHHPGNPYQTTNVSDHSRNWGSVNESNDFSSQAQQSQSRRPLSNDNPGNPYQIQQRKGEANNNPRKSHYQNPQQRPPTNDYINNPHQRQQQQQGGPKLTRWQDDHQNHSSYNQNQSSTFDYEDNDSYDISKQPGEKMNPFITAKELVPSFNDTSRGGNQGGGGGGRDDEWDNYGSKGGGGVNNRSTTSSVAPPGGPQQLARAAIRGPKDNMSAGLKRKFQPPMKREGGGGSNCGQNSVNNGDCNNKGSSSSSNRQASGGGGSSGGNNANNEDEELPEELRGLDKELIEKIMNEIVDTGEKVTFDDIAGLKQAKETVNEIVIMPMIRPDLFTGLRACPKGLLLFGPPGTGKTLIGKAIAHESRATFFSISSSSLTSKWIGEGEKLVRTLFAVASYRAPSVVFIDEVDSMLTQRKADENEASRRIKTEFLVQLDGAGNGRKGQVLVIGATNRPEELDDAARRRFVKKLYIPLPDQDGREALITNLLKANAHTLTDAQLTQLAIDSEGFSGADLKTLCTDAAMEPVRKLGAKAMEMDPKDVPPISYKNFRKALRQVNPSVAQSDLASHIEWNNTYGSMIAPRSDDSSQESDTGSVDD